MAKDEMRQIAHDTWSESLWGTRPVQGAASIVIVKSNDSTTPASPKLYFYFGENDHWVADTTRDNLISTRARRGSFAEDNRPVMEVDTNGVPHGFCLRPEHNEIVAERVVAYVMEMAETL